MSPNKRLAIEPLLPRLGPSTQKDLPSPLFVVQTQAKKAKSNQQSWMEEKAATVASMRNGTRPEELRWARGLSGHSVSYPCKVLSYGAKHALNASTKAMLKNKDLLDKELVCFFLGKQVYFSAVPDHDSLPFFVPGDMAYITRCDQPAQMKTTSRTAKRLLMQLPTAVAVFDAIYRRATSLVVTEARMEQNAIDMKRRKSIVTQLRFEALFSTEKRVEMDLPLFRYLAPGDTVILPDDVSRAKVHQLVKGAKDKYICCKYIQAGTAKVCYLSKDVSVRRVIPMNEAEEVLRDALRITAEYVTPVGPVSSFHFLMEEDHTFVEKCVRQAQKLFK